MPGELYIGGVGVARGYLGRPGLTAEKFVPDPFAAAPGARLYRTGDRARFLDGGDIEFLGRMDFQVKIRGYRIETGEVENVLAAQPGVRDVLVMARADGAGGLRLVAYVAAGEDARDADALRRVLRQKLPEYMIPAAFVFMDRFPVGSTGKLDRRALPEPAAVEREGGEGYAAPRTETERALAELWEEVLSVSPVGVDDDFFALGGHSMLALRAMTDVRRRFGVDLPLSALFEHPTVAGLARLLDGGADGAAEAGEGASPLVAIQPHGDRVPVFFVHPVGGQVLCYTDLARQLGPDQPFYGLQARDLATAAGEPVTVQGMAAEYVAAIRRVRPRGPYLLGGWSFGAFVAFEMARQLTEAGEEVPLLALLDPDSPEQARRTADVEESVLLAHLAREQGLQAGRRVALTADDLRPLDADARVERVLAALCDAGLAAGHIEVAWVRRLLAGYNARKRAVAAYQPRTYAGRVLLFAPAEHDADAESARWWSPGRPSPAGTRTRPGPCRCTWCRGSTPRWPPGPTPNTWPGTFARPSTTAFLPERDRTQWHSSAACTSSSRSWCATPGTFGTRTCWAPASSRRPWRAGLRTRRWSPW